MDIVYFLQKGNFKIKPNRKKLQRLIWIPLGPVALVSFFLLPPSSVGILPEQTSLPKATVHAVFVFKEKQIKSFHAQLLGDQ